MPLPDVLVEAMPMACWSGMQMGLIDVGVANAGLFNAWERAGCESVAHNVLPPNEN